MYGIIDHIKLRIYAAKVSRKKVVIANFTSEYHLQKLDGEEVVVTRLVGWWKPEFSVLTFGGAESRQDHVPPTGFKSVQKDRAALPRGVDRRLFGGATASTEEKTEPHKKSRFAANVVRVTA